MSDIPSPPVILFPMNGCPAVGSLTQEQEELRLKQLREMIRQERSNPGLKAVIELMEMRCARLQKEAMRPGETEHFKGQAFGLMEMVGLVQSIVLSQEKAG